VRVHAMTVNGTGPPTPWIVVETFTRDLDGKTASLQLAIYRYFSDILEHRRSQGVHWVGARASPGRRNKIWGPNLQGKVVSAPQAEIAPLPEAEQESNFLRKLGDLDDGRGYLGSFSVCFAGDD